MSRVPQGSILRHLLFLLNKSDLVALSCSVFLDDAQVVRANDSTNVAGNLETLTDRAVKRDVPLE